MMHGDISNGVPPRVLVHLDVISVVEERVEPFLKIFKHKTEYRMFDKLMLSAMWRYAATRQVSLELFAVGIDQQEMDDALERLDNLQVHPFRAGIVYPTLHALTADVLPYRQDILGIIDLPERGLRYGSRWIDLTQI